MDCLLTRYQELDALCVLYLNNKLMLGTIIVTILMVKKKV